MLLDDENCPIPLETLGLLYRVPEAADEALSQFTPRTRARLALYCAQRSHLRTIGFTVASTCELSDLYTIGGKAGAALFEDSRCEHVKEAEPHHSRNRKKISLASRAA